MGLMVMFDLNIFKRFYQLSNIQVKGEGRIRRFERHKYMRLSKYIFTIAHISFIQSSQPSYSVKSSITNKREEVR
jgi:hypothetical protein